MGGRRSHSRAWQVALAVSAVLGAMLATAIPAAGQEVGSNVSGAGGGLASGLGLGTRSADPCSLYEPNTACTNARGETVSLSFAQGATWRLTCSDFPPFYGARPYVSTNEYSIDTVANPHAFTDPGIPLDEYAQDPNSGKYLWLKYSITVTNWGTTHDFTPVLACY